MRIPASWCACVLAMISCTQGSGRETQRASTRSDVATRITATACGPITASTLPDLPGLRELFPGFAVSSSDEKAQGDADHVFEVSRHGQLSLVLGFDTADNNDPDDVITFVEIHDATFATLGGTAVGTTVKGVAAKEGAVECSVSSGHSDPMQFDLECVAKSLPNVVFSVDRGSVLLPDGIVPIESIAHLKVTVIHWMSKAMPRLDPAKNPLQPMD